MIIPKKNFTHEKSGRVWHDFTRFHIKSVPSKITWLGRIIGHFRNHSLFFFLNPDDATKLHRYLTENVPWYKELNPKEPGALEFMPYKAK